MTDINVSYAQLGAIHSTAGQLEIDARRRGEKLYAGLFVGSLKGTKIERAPELGSDSVVVTFRRYEAPDIVRRYSYFGNAERIAFPAAS